MSVVIVVVVVIVTSIQPTASCVLARHAISSFQFSLGLLQLEAIIYFQWVCKTPMSARLPYQSKNHSRAPVHQKVRSTDHINWMLHTHTRLKALCPGLPGSARTRKIKSIRILLKQQTVSGSGISWAICKSAPHSRQITMPAPHHSLFIGWMPFLLPNQQRQRTEGVFNWRLQVYKMKWR